MSGAPMGRPPAVPPAQRDEFARMWGEGVPTKVIADKYGCTETSVYRIRKRLGLPARKKEPMWSHGAGAYAHGACRCDVCTEANRERVKRRRLERYAEPKDPNDPRHGKRSFYINHGCRCEPCTEAHAVACSDYYQRTNAA